jgi:hypothetical protein
MFLVTNNIDGQYDTFLTKVDNYRHSDHMHLLLASFAMPSIQIAKAQYVSSGGS